MTIRPLIQVPTWDGKIVLGAIFIIGYYSLVIIMLSRGGDLPATKAGIVRDAMLALGPGIGIILGALFRNTAAEERRDALRSTELQTAITTPGASPTGDTADDVEKGARDGTRQGVEDALDQPSPVGDRVDRGRFPDIEPIVAPLPDDEPIPDYARP